jgi:hypothetical protein
MSKRVTFAVFALAMLFATMREWSTPAACARPLLLPPVVSSR